MFDELIKTIGIDNLRQRPNLLKIIFNTLWLFADKIIRMGAGVFIGVWMARYLGTERFGMYNYVIAFSSLFGILGTLSLDNIIIKELLGEKYAPNVLLGTSFFLRLCGSIIATIFSVICIYFVRSGNSLMITLIFLSSLSFLFQSFYVIDFYFQAHLKSKFSFFSQNLAFIIIAILKVYFIISKASLSIFVGLYSLEFFLAMLLFIFNYSIMKQSIYKWKVSFCVAKQLLKSSYSLILSGFAVIIYMRLDQIMIGQMLGDSEVGIYSAAIKISEVWYFIPVAIASSIFPGLIKLKNENEELYKKRIKQMYNFMAIMGFCVAILVSFLSTKAIHLLYGPAFSGSAKILSITIWTGVMICLSTIHSRWLILENLQHYSLFYTIMGAVSNIIANLFLIKSLGAAGAAYGTLIAQFTPLLIALSFKKVRPNILNMIKAIFAPVTVFYKLLRK